MAIDGKQIKRVLIAGAGGAGGSCLAEYLHRQQPHVEVHGIVRRIDAETRENLAGIAGNIKLYECDLADMASTCRIVKEVKADVIFNLASDADVPASFARPQAVLSNNILSACNLFEAVRSNGLDPIIKHCSTSEVYGDVDPKNSPVTEVCPIQPSNPYAVSKAAADFLALTYFTSYGMKIIRSRVFGYVNPRRDNLFTSAFAKQVARIEAGLQRELTYGNLNSVRTLVDSRDVMEAYWLSVLHCEAGEVYNIGGDATITVGEFLEVLKKKAKVPIPAREDPELLRPSDMTLQVPNTEKFRKAAGWKPKIGFEEMVDHLLDAWRGKVRGETQVHARKA